MQSLDRLFDTLSRERRRYALYVLDNADGAVEINKLAEQIRQLEEDGDGTSDRARDVRLSLEHHHLPKASRAEYIEYDRDGGEIRITGEPTDFQIILTVSEAIEDSKLDPLFDSDTTTAEKFLRKLTPARQQSD